MLCTNMREEVLNHKEIEMGKPTTEFMLFLISP